MNPMKIISKDRILPFCLASALGMLGGVTLDYSIDKSKSQMVEDTFSFSKERVPSENWQYKAGFPGCMLVGFSGALSGFGLMKHWEKKDKKINDNQS